MAIQIWGSSPACLLKPRVIYRRGSRGWDSACADVPNDGQGLLQGLVHAEGLVPPLRLLGRLLHQSVLVFRRIQVSQELCVDKFFYLFNQKKTNKKIQTTKDINKNLYRKYNTEQIQGEIYGSRRLNRFFLLPYTSSSGHAILHLWGDTSAYSSFQTSFPTAPRSQLAFWAISKWLTGK